MRRKSLVRKQRAEIDAIDREIVALFERRTQVDAVDVVVLKRNGIAILDASREKEAIAKVQSYLKMPHWKKSWQSYEIFDEGLKGLSNKNKEDKMKLQVGDYLNPWFFVINSRSFYLRG